MTVYVNAVCPACDGDKGSMRFDPEKKKNIVVNCNYCSGTGKVRKKVKEK